MNLELTISREEIGAFAFMEMNAMILTLKWDHTGELSSADRGNILRALHAAGRDEQGDRLLTAAIVPEE